MERIAPKIIFVFLLSLTAYFGASAQETKTMVFKYEDPKQEQRENLADFLSRLPKQTFKSDCMFASGYFRFQVTDQGKIDTMEIAGDLPAEVITVIRTRVLETQKYWEPVKGNNGFKPGRWIVLPVFIDRQIDSDCRDDKHVQEHEKMILDLFEIEDSMIRTSTSYLLRPVIFFAMQ